MVSLRPIIPGGSGDRFQSFILSVLEAVVQLPLLLVVSGADQVLEAGALGGTKGRWSDMLHGRPEQSGFGNVALVVAERKLELGGETR